MQIALAHGRYALVDKDDYKHLKEYSWIIYKDKCNWYTYRRFKTDGKYRRVLMHRDILNVPQGMEIDHINHNGLDNRKSNLRVCTHQENLRNQVIHRTKKSSIYKGVSWREYCKSWRAYITIYGKTRHLGYFRDEKAAARVYDKEARRLFGNFSSLNFPLSA